MKRDTRRREGGEGWVSLVNLEAMLPKVTTIATLGNAVFLRFSAECR